jgi:hypothetical protein
MVFSSVIPSTVGRLLHSNTENEVGSGLILFRSIIVFLFAGIAVLLGLLSVSYIMVLVLDKCCCCLSQEDVVFDRSDVTRQAGLFGLRQKERMQILELIFESHTTIFDPKATEKEKPTPDSDNVDIEQGTSSSIKVTSLSRGCASQNDIIHLEQIADGLDNVVIKVDDEQHESTCCICLSSYEPGQKILSGTQCVHMFHKDCCMEWLSTRKNNCPYCRVSLFTAREMKASALKVLGEQRVQDLATILRHRDS